MVNALIFLDEVTNLNGPLMIVPGSHRLEAGKPEDSTQGTSYTLRYAEPDAIESEVRRGGVVAPTGPAGSVIFMNPNALHGSTANLSPWPRRMITLTYNAMSNKATSPSVRPRDIVYDDTDLPALVPLDEAPSAPARPPPPGARVGRYRPARVDLEYSTQMVRFDHGPSETGT